MSVIDWLEVWTTSLYIFFVGAFMVFATTEVGWWAITFPIVFAVGNVINRIESYRLGNIRRGR